MTEDYGDFREVAHCGGKVTFHVKIDEKGVRAFSVGYSGSSPTPMSLFGVYALPQGIACGNIELGGIGQASNPPPFPDCIPVFVGSDSQGQFGHECPDCKGYWRSSGAPSRWPMTCPYCGVRGATWRFLTQAQRRYVTHYARTLTEALASGEPSLDAVIDMDAASDAATIPKPAFYYSGQTQQTKFICVACGANNDVRGRYVYCSLCGTRNNAQILRSDLDALRARLNDGQSQPPDALKSSVSAFDSCCGNLLAQLVDRVPLTPDRKNKLSKMLFHRIEKAAGELRTVFDIHLFQGLEEEDISFVRLRMHRRHAFEHDGGHATAHYIRESGDTTVAEGSLIRESKENVHRMIGLLSRMASNFDRGFHELFSPEEKPVAYEREHQSHIRRQSERR